MFAVGMSVNFVFKCKLVGISVNFVCVCMCVLTQTAMYALCKSMHIHSTTRVRACA